MIREQIHSRKYLKNIFIFLILIFGLTLLPKVFKSDTTEQLWNSTWEVQSFNESGMEISLPMKLKQLDPNPKSNVDSYSFESRHIAIILNRIKFENELDIPTNQVANRLMNNFLLGMNAADLKLKEDVDHSNDSINFISGTLSFDKVKKEITQLCVRKEAVYYILIISYKQGDEYGRKIKDKIISSVH